MTNLEWFQTIGAFAGMLGLSFIVLHFVEIVLQNMKEPNTNRCSATTTMHPFCVCYRTKAHDKEHDCHCGQSWGDL